MIKKVVLLATLLSMISGVAYSASPRVQKQARDGDTAVDFGMMTVDFTASNTAGVYSLGFSYPIFSLNWSESSGFVGEIHVCDTPNAGGASDLSASSQCDIVSNIAASDVSISNFRSYKRYILVEITTAGTGYLTIKGSWDQAQINVDYTQPDPNPNQGLNEDGVIANIKDPADTKLGYGVSFGSGQEFDANPANEPDNMMGSFYNKEGINSTGAKNQYEHALDASWETAYRGTEETNDETWLELNYDLWPAQNRVVVSSHDAGFNPTAGTIVTFSAGTNARGYAVSWTAGTDTFEWRHDFGELEGTTVTVTEAASDGSDTATFSVADVVARNVTEKWRAHQFEWYTNRDQAYWYWQVDPDNPLLPLRISAYDDIGSVGINFNGNIASRGLSVGNHADNLPATYMESQTGSLVTGQNGAIQWESQILDLKHDFTGTSNRYGSSSAIRILTPSATGASSTQVDGRRRAINISSQLGYGAAGSAIYIHPQTCGAGATTCASQPAYFGNITLGGGNWNNGHVAFGEEWDLGDHFFRDQTNEVLRIATDDAPDSETDGDIVLTSALTTSDPCSSKPEGYVFYNDTSNYFCFCNGSDDVQMHSPATACF